ncbi:MAG: hypothetical protein V4467_00620 [Patescibacteria group bacterium]
MKKLSLKSKFTRVFLLSVFSLLLVSSFSISVSPVFASCTDDQVNAWLSSHNMTREGNNGTALNQAYAALGNCSGGGGGAITSIAGLLNRAIGVINLLIPFLVGLGVFVIIYGIFTYISQAADEEARKQARDFIMWGVIGVVLMLSVWGLVNILYNTLGIDNTNTTVHSRYPVIPLVGAQ